jgi:hypothetical protein
MLDYIIAFWMWKGLMNATYLQAVICENRVCNGDCCSHRGAAKKQKSTLVVMLLRNVQFVGLLTVGMVVHIHTER